MYSPFIIYEKSKSSMTTTTKLTPKRALKNSENRDQKGYNSKTQYV